MSARLPDEVYDDPRIGEAGRLAGFLWVCGLAWCSRHLTDGAIPEPMVARLGGNADEAAALVAVGLWERTERGFTMVGYLDTQPSAERVRAERARRTEIERRSREKHAPPVAQRVTQPNTQPVAQPVAQRVLSSPLLSSPISDHPPPPSGAPPPSGEAPPAKSAKVAKAPRTPKPPRPAAHPFPADYEPDAGLVELARAHRTDLAAVVEQVRDWAAAKGERKVDWTAAIRGWIRRGAQRGDLPAMRSGVVPRALDAPLAVDRQWGAPPPEAVAAIGALLNGSAHRMPAVTADLELPGVLRAAR